MPVIKSLSDPSHPDLARLHALHDEIFADFKEAGGSYQPLERWVDRVRNNDGRIYYAVLDDNEPVAVMFTIQRKQGVTLPTGQVYDETRHVNITGTLEAHRRSGLMNALLKAMLADCQAGTIRQELLTINTYPAQFVNMPKWLDKTGWTFLGKDEQTQGKVGYFRRADAPLAV